MTFADFFQSIDFQGRCDSSPCAIEQNGQVVTPWHLQHPIRLLGGDFVQVQTTAHLGALTAVTGAHDSHRVARWEDKPAGFQQQAPQAMQGRGIEDDQLLLLAGHFQLSMTSWSETSFASPAWTSSTRENWDCSF